MNGQQERVHAALQAYLGDQDFPCLGAKSVINQGSYSFGFYPWMTAPDSNDALAADLARFIDTGPPNPGHFSSFVACFQGPKVGSPKTFEQLLWCQLIALHQADMAPWNTAVSSDPQDPEFSFSFGGQAFFVVGLMPSNTRWARRFPWPTLVFNEHGQFDRLRQEQRFESMKAAIRARDESLHGSPNEMLTDYGVHSEARQYAGRNVGANWRCPVRFNTHD